MTTDQTDLFAAAYSSSKAPSKVRIEFDGGTPCNIPRLGYGYGYGSYQIQNCATGELLPIVRIQFGKPMSANVAEVSTLIRALQEVERLYGKEIVLEIHGDSQIALNHAACKRPAGKKGRARLANGAGLFQVVARELRELVSGFFYVETKWRGRARSVKVFGH